MVIKSVPPMVTSVQAQLYYTHIHLRLNNIFKQYYTHVVCTMYCEQLISWLKEFAAMRFYSFLQLSNSDQLM